MTPSAPFASRVQNITLSATKQMPIIAAQVGGCVSLGQGVPSFGTPEHVVEAVGRALTDDPGVGKYSLQPGLPELRRAIARSLADLKELDYDPDTEIAVTVGAMGALADAFLAIIEPGDEVLLPDPVYASYIEQVHLAGGRPLFAPLNPDNWGLDLEALAGAITPRTRAIVLCNPSNPTGGVYDDAQIAAATRLAKERNLWIISDETYDYLTYSRSDGVTGPGRTPLSPAAAPGGRERTIVINSFSKKYALTGWRAGYMAAPAEVMEQLMKVHDATAICAPTPGQHAALAALTGPQAVVSEMNEIMMARRDLACRRMDRLAQWLDYVPPTGAFYIMARYKFTDAPSAEVAVRLIREARVVTVPGGSFGPAGEGCLRLSFGGASADLNEAFDRVERWLERI